MKGTIDKVDGNLKSPPLIEVTGMVMVSGKKAKGTNDKADENLKRPSVFQVTGKVMVSGNIMSVEKSGAETNAESGETMTKEDGMYYKGAARSKKAYDAGGDKATAIREVVHKAAEKKKRADDGEDGEVAVRRSTRRK